MLATLDNAIETIGDEFGPCAAQELTEARAAVAELIAAAHEVRNNWSDYESPDWLALEAALVRVGAVQP